MFIERVNQMQEKLGLKLSEVIADLGYGSVENLKELKRQEIRSNIPLWIFL